MIGILSSIAIPSFQNASEKAKQKEASSLVASYVKAAQAYYTEYSLLATQPRNLGEYVTVTGCRYSNAAQCKSQSNAIVDYSRSTTRQWNSPSGNYYIQIRPSGSTRVNYLAIPRTASAMGAVGCFSTSTGATRVQEMNAQQKGPGNVRPISC